MNSTFITILKKELLTLNRNRGEWLIPILFFTLIVVLFPLALSFEFKVLPIIGPGVIWFSCLLAILLSIEQIFREDYNNGTLEQLRLSTKPLVRIVLYKIILHWLSNILPLLLILPIVGIIYSLSTTTVMFSILSLLLGTISLQFVGALVASLTLSLPRSGMLVFVIILPLFVPVLLFSTNIIWQQQHNLPISGNIAMLLAFGLICVSVLPFVIAKIISWD